MTSLAVTQLFEKKKLVLKILHPKKMIPGKELLKGFSCSYAKLLIWDHKREIQVD
jgi:hypothetical protein